MIHWPDKILLTNGQISKEWLEALVKDAEIRFSKRWQPKLSYAKQMEKRWAHQSDENVKLIQKWF